MRYRIPQNCKLAQVPQIYAVGVLAYLFPFAIAPLYAGDNKCVKMECL